MSAWMTRPGSACTEMLPDERKESAIAFLGRAWPGSRAWASPSSG